MQRSGDGPIPPVVWVVIAGAFVLVIASADSAAEGAAQVGVMLALLGIYVVVRARR
jgi:hypothetical protein